MTPDACHKFHDAVTQLRRFFLDHGFVEVHPQSQLSILAACEDPATIATFEYNGQIWPLPQTGQMHLEHYLLKNPDMPGFFCVTTSYRQEPNPMPGRHETIFPMFEFELPGGIEDLLALEEDLCYALGFEEDPEFIFYDWATHLFGVKELTAEHEEKLFQQNGPVVFLEKFPLRTSPFRNMAVSGNHARKVDVLLYGMETIGSAERSTDKDQMREHFYTISNGAYAETLFAKFGRERVEAELNEFLSMDFFQRSGGGIGMTRLLRALDLQGK